MAKTIYVEIAVRIDEDADPFATIENCDYSFTGEDILSHEIVGLVDDRDQTLF